MIECDAETKNENSFLDKSGKIELSNASGQTREFSRSGQYALKLSKNAPYGMGITLRKLKPGDLLEVSVWALGTGLICVSADNPEDFYLTAEKEANSSNDKWSLISLNLEVPSGLKSDSLNICDFSDRVLLTVFTYIVLFEYSWFVCPLPFMSE